MMPFLRLHPRVQQSQCENERPHPQSSTLQLSDPMFCHHLYCSCSTARKRTVAVSFLSSSVSLLSRQSKASMGNVLHLTYSVPGSTQSPAAQESLYWLWLNYWGLLTNTHFLSAARGHGSSPVAGSPCPHYALHVHLKADSPRKTWAFLPSHPLHTSWTPAATTYTAFLKAQQREGPGNPSRHLLSLVSSISAF